MNTRLTHRASRFGSRSQLIGIFIDKAGYITLAFIALWASVRFPEYGEQFITLAIILGWKWICGNSTQVIQIYTQDDKEYK